MTIKKWIYISAAAVFLAAAVILSVTAGLIKWRKKANYPPSSAAITARSLIRFIPKDSTLSSDKLKVTNGYVKFYAEESAIGFIAFQSALDNQGLKISDVCLFFPISRININLWDINNKSCTLNINKLVSIAANNVITASFILHDVVFSFNYQNKKIVSAIGTAEVNLQYNQKLSDVQSKQVYEGFLQDAGNYKSTLIIKTSVFENNDSRGKLLLIIDEISYKVV